MPDLGMATFDEILAEFNDRGESVVLFRIMKDPSGSVHTDYKVTNDLLTEEQMKLVAKIFVLTAQRIDPCWGPRGE